MNDNRNNTTPPLKIGSITIGATESSIQPFENAMTDFTDINKHLIKNPAYKTHIIPDALVSNCSECCMLEINGEPNILGMFFRKSRAEQGCRGCPVSLASEHLPARNGEGERIRDNKGQIISEAAIIQISEDSET